MNLKGISLNLAGVNFKSKLPQAPEGYEYARDYGCPEGGMYLRKLEEDTFESPSKRAEKLRQEELEYYEKSQRECPEGYKTFFTDDDRCVFIPDNETMSHKAKVRDKVYSDAIQHDCPKGYRPFYTDDGRCIFVPNSNK